MNQKEGASMNDDEEDEERVLSILGDEYDFHRQLGKASTYTFNTYGDSSENERADLSVPDELLSKIQTLFGRLRETLTSVHYLVQFWAAFDTYLSTSHPKFTKTNALGDGAHSYRDVCLNRVYRVDEEAEEEQVGRVGWVFRNKIPESTPDLRLYSTKEFPLRDHAARCGFRAYSVFPLYEFDGEQCYGVLEILSYDWKHLELFYAVYRELQVAGLRIKPTHIEYMPIIGEMPLKYKMQSSESEITDIFELAVKAVPGLQLVQIWVPCKQCTNMSSKSCCLERVWFINNVDKIANSSSSCDDALSDYVRMCNFHSLQIDFSCFRRNLFEISISKDPLAHYAQRARLLHCFVICLRSKDNRNHFNVIEVFLQLKCREDPCSDSSLHLLLRILEMKLKRFEFVWGEQIPEELKMVQSRQPNAIECESIGTLKVMNSCKTETFFTKYLETVGTCCRRPFSKDSRVGWVFSQPPEVELSENTSLWVPENIIYFMTNMEEVRYGKKYWIVQFWAPVTVDNRCHLETSSQPYVVSCLAKGLASFRKQCMKHHYFVDEEAKEEEPGPPGRVFRNGHPEITPDLLFYSTKEFKMRNYGVNCCLEGYFALPVFDKCDSRRKCIGVLEFVGFDFDSLKGIAERLEAGRLCSTHVDFRPRFLENDLPASITKCRNEALNEVKVAFSLIAEIPQLHSAKVWVPNEKCASTIDSHTRCMELAFTTRSSTRYMPTDEVHWMHVQPRKGTIGMVLESESKSCFCQNLSEFSIVDQPLAHNERSERLDVCFALGLQSSHTGPDLLYVVEFFLNQSPGYLESFFTFLLPILMQELKSFTYASGRQLGEELVVEVIQFSDTNKHNFSELEQLDGFPFKFKSVRYTEMEHQHNGGENQMQCDSDAMEIEQCSAAAAAAAATASDSKKTQRAKRKSGFPLKAKRKSGFPLNLDHLMPHFGKKLADVSKELGVGRSTIKRVLRKYGIDRWPCTEKQARNALRQLDTSQHTDMESTQHCSNMEKVTIKVGFEEDVIKFELCLSLGVLDKVFKEVGRRLNLKKDAFKLTYSDEDGDVILVTCDADLEACPKSQTATGKTCIRLYVKLIPQ